MAGCSNSSYAFVVDTSAEPEPVDTLALALPSIRDSSSHSHRSITGFQVIDDFPPFIYDSCEYAKDTCKPIRKVRAAPQAQAFGEEVHIDVWSHLPPTLSLGRRRYYIIFTDKYPLRGSKYFARKTRPFRSTSLSRFGRKRSTGPAFLSHARNSTTWSFDFRHLT